MMAGVEPNREEMRKALLAGYPTATDLADYLARRGVPFRTAHDIVGRVVRLASERGCDIADLTLEELREFSDVITEQSRRRHGSGSGSSASRALGEDLC